PVKCELLAHHVVGADAKITAGHEVLRAGVAAALADDRREVVESAPLLHPTALPEWAALLHDADQILVIALGVLEIVRSIVPAVHALDDPAGGGSIGGNTPVRTGDPPQLEGGLAGVLVLIHHVLDLVEGLVAVAEAVRAPAG